MVFEGEGRRGVGGGGGNKIELHLKPKNVNYKHITQVFAKH